MFHTHTIQGIINRCSRSEISPLTGTPTATKLPMKFFPFYHSLTGNGAYELKVEMTRYDGEYREGTYSKVSVTGDFYTLTLGEWNPLDTHQFDDFGAFHNNSAFSTPDRDNDTASWTHLASDLGQFGW